MRGNRVPCLTCSAGNYMCFWTHDDRRSLTSNRTSENIWTHEPPGVVRSSGTVLHNSQGGGGWRQGEEDNWRRGGWDKERKISEGEKDERTEGWEKERRITEGEKDERREGREGEEDNWRRGGWDNERKISEGEEDETRRGGWVTLWNKDLLLRMFPLVKSSILSLTLALLL